MSDDPFAPRRSGCGCGGCLLTSVILTSAILLGLGAGLVSFLLLR